MSKKLIVKNFPGKFTEKDKIDFIQLFGGVNITCMRGKLKNCCYVEFEDMPSAQQGLEVLHQFELLGHRLVAEYAKPIHEKVAGEINSKIILDKTTSFVDKAKVKQTIDSVDSALNDSLLSGVAPNLGLNHTFPAHLHYKYPEPNIVILTNIANALASVPRFYTLVLHLMNKLNLPPPFTGITPTPPLPDDGVSMKDQCVDTEDLCDFVSSDESEIESDSETKKHEIYQNKGTNFEILRKRKRLRPIASKNQQKFQIPKSKTELPVESAFELGSTVKRLEFKLGDSIKNAVEKKQPPPVHYNVFDERGAFGRMEPAAKITRIEDEDEKNDLPKNVLESQKISKTSLEEEQDMEAGGENIEKEDKKEEEDDEDEEEDEHLDYITLKKIKDNKISSSEILKMNQFKKYNMGDRTNRLYVKNIGKQVTTEDLHFIFKRFIADCSEDEKANFDLRHMKEGRMKGQAFVTFPNEMIAEKALKTVHGYILHEKPLIIQYGKSGK